MKTQNTIATILSYSGSTTIGLFLGHLIRSGEAIWALAGVGAALSGVSIAMNIDKKIWKALEICNSDYPEDETTQVAQPQLDVLAKANGLGLSMRF
ncbi:MAG: hypothetical protein Q4F57_04775 [Weeksellaceae bacterium]|nr:hypothetical protein [Weeksellaceae bacterium]